MKHQDRKVSYFGFNTRKSTKWYSQSGFSASESIALIALMLEANVGGMVYASQRQLADLAQCSRQTLNKGLQSLIERNLVYVVGRAQYQISDKIGNKFA